MTDYEKLEERRQMARSNYYAQMEMMGYGSDGNALDLVKVVRCKNCKYWETEWKPNHSIDGEHFCPMISLVTSGEWFCAYGERMDDDGKDA